MPKPRSGLYGMKIKQVDKSKLPNYTRPPRAKNAREEAIKDYKSRGFSEGEAEILLANTRRKKVYDGGEYTSRDRAEDGIRRGKAERAESRKRMDRKIYAGAQGRPPTKLKNPKRTAPNVKSSRGKSR